MKLLSVLSSEFTDKLKKLRVKIWNGRSRTYTADEASPFGHDSRPIKGMVAIYMPTERDGDEVIVGYLNKDRLAAVGENRLFSTDANGVLKAYVWMKADGTIHFKGSTDNLVKWTPLNTALQNEVQAINTELAKIATGLNAIVTGSYVMAPVTLNINAAKHADLKTS